MYAHGYFFWIFMKEEFNFYNVQLKSKNKDGKFYFEARKQKSKVYEVSVEQFKLMLVSVNNTEKISHTDANKRTLDFLLDQLEQTEEMFDAMLYQTWIYDDKKG